MTERSLLIVEGNPRRFSDAIAASGGTVAADLFTRVLAELRPDARCATVRPADPDGALPSGTALADYDAVVWTGSGLSVYWGGAEVTRQIDLMRAAFAAGARVFGSCWGLQVAVAAAGGTVIPNPNGCEIGIARKIRLTELGRVHPMYDGKASVFDALCVHRDEIGGLPNDGAIVLASNAISAVQALDLRCDRGRFWGVQYHPEYDLNEIACLIGRTAVDLVADGLVADHAGVSALKARVLALHDDPGRRDLAWQLGIDRDILDAGVRRAELANWLDHLTRDGNRLG